MSLDLSIPIAETALRATVVLIGALGIGLLLRRASGTARHALWTATTGALLALPLLQGALPTLPIAWWTADQPVPVEAPMVSTDEAVTVSALPVAATFEEPLPQVEVAEQAAAGLPVGTLVTLAWLIGVFGVAVPLALGHVRARRLVRRASACHDGRLLVRFTAAAHAVGVCESVRLLLSDAVRTPMTGGLLHPVVLLPATARDWSDDCLDTVFKHELVHVRRRDALRQFASRFAVALYWFHPLAWRAAREGALAREQACDEAVVGLGTRPSRYARHLLDLADPVAAPNAAPALVRLDHPHLEERVMAILRASPAPASRRQTALATLGIATWTLCVAAAGPATAQTPRAPEPPPAPVAVPAPLAMADAAMPEAPLPPLPALAAPAAAAPLPPLPPVAGAYDCEAVGRSYRTGSSDRDVPVRMHTTTVDGIRICAAIRGRIGETDRFVPAGRLPVGVVVTLASSGPDGEQRLEITGTSGGNTHHWEVDGRERPFDAAAAEWRDAMLAIVDASVEKARIRDREARLRGEIARANGDEARLRGEIARVRGQQAATEARIASRAAAEVARGQVAEVRVASRARLAEVEARQAEAVARVEERVAAGQVRVQARQAALDAQLADGEVEPRVAQRMQRELQAAEEAMARDQERIVQEQRRMEREVDRLRQREEQAAVRAIEQAEQRAVRSRELREIQAIDEVAVREREAQARIRAIEERMAGAEVAGRVRATEQRISELQADRRIAEIDARMDPLEARLRRAIERVTP